MSPGAQVPPPGADGTPVPQVRRALHDATAELSNAVLRLSLLLEDEMLEPQRRLELEEALQSCREAAARLREIWPLLG